MTFIGFAKKGWYSADTTYNNQPLRLQNFSARVVSSNTITLDWLTAETWANVTHYQIYRSTNNIDYISVGAVLQRSNNPIDQVYSYNDVISSMSSEKSVYYKLKQVNSNGNISWSHIITVKLTGTAKNEITTWPNPTVNEININFINNYDNTIHVQYFDGTGKLMSQEQFKGSKGVSIIKSEAIRNFKAGVYIVMVSSGKELIGTQKLTKL
jgi:hypothetical protein